MTSGRHVGTALSTRPYDTHPYDTRPYGTHPHDTPTAYGPGPPDPIASAASSAGVRPATNARTR